MKKTKRLIIANWKMNPVTADRAKEIFQSVRAAAAHLKSVKVVVCPPFVYLPVLEKANLDSPVSLGAQDVFWEKVGSFTGEISPLMLKKTGESYVIIGHSERRALGETDEIIAKKVLAAAKAGLRVILCIGEKARDEHGEYLHFLRQQIIGSIGKLPKPYLSKLVIAYEPVWAIGRSESTALPPGELHSMVIFIKKTLLEIYKNLKTGGPLIIYGGSVGLDNAEALLSLGEIQGLLVGRESLNPKRFGELLKKADF